MVRADLASEWLRLAERYRQMSDGELVALARQDSELTEAAQQTLAGEVSRRGLTLPRKNPPPSPEPEPDPDSPCAQDRELIEVRKVWSLQDALQLQAPLDLAGIPFYLGEEKARRADAVTSSFGNGVSVRVMRVGRPWAWQAMRDYAPVSERAEPPDEEWQEIPVHCPKCQSTEVAFERLVPDRATALRDKLEPQFEWACHACGNR
jgi:hypothetical protein